MGLRVRVILLVVVTVLVTEFSWGLSRVQSESEQLHDSAVRHGQEVLRALAASCSVPLATRRIEELDAILARFADEPNWQRFGLVEVAIVDADGVVVAHTDPRQFGTARTDPFTIAALGASRATARRSADDAALQLSVPITSGLRWGTATATVSLSEVQARIARSRDETLLMSFALSAFLALVLYIGLARAALRPLEQLTMVVRNIRDGTLQARFPRGRSDEVGILGEVFNEMADQIQTYTVQLEEKVAARTAELEAANEELGRLARTDGLTGLANHRAFHEHLARELDRARRYGQPLSLLMIDVDHFKVYNDTHGHPAGDRVLRRIAELFRRRLRSVDIAARYGGEEFGLILPATPLEAATRVAEQLVAAVRETAFEGGQEQPRGRVTISAGVARWDGKEAPAGLLERADAAMYEAKQTGRDQARIATASPLEGTTS